MEVEWSGTWSLRVAQTLWTSAYSYEFLFEELGKVTQLLPELSVRDKHTHTVDRRERERESSLLHAGTPRKNIAARCYSPYTHKYPMSIMALSNHPSQSMVWPLVTTADLSKYLPPPREGLVWNPYRLFYTANY